MANFLCSLITSSRPPTALNLYQRMGRTSPTHAASFMSTTNKWNIPEDHRLISNQSKHNNYHSGYPGSTEELSMLHGQKLKETRKVLREMGEDPFEGLVMIDALQRLGIDYHFQEEIGAVLHSQYVNCSAGRYPQHDLYEVSTRFRLFRQNGYKVPADVFKIFTDKEGSFKSELNADIRGLMGLYEASQLSMEGEDILDQAAEFSGQLLNAWITNLDHHQARVITNTLRHPYHKSLTRFMAKSYHGDYRGSNAWVKRLQQLAKMDFQMVRSTYQKEALHISKWWKDTGLTEGLKFARHQPLKWYTWTMAALTDPSLSEQRVELTKPISFVYLIDDIFDVYGRIEELALFTEVINRWDIAAAEQLPDYMEICFKALDEMTNKFADKVYKEHGWNPLDSLRKTWAGLCYAFLVEAKWFASGQMPKAEEYLKNGITSSGVHVILFHAFFFTGHRINKESVNLVVNDDPGIITSVATILRLSDDLAGVKEVNQEGHDGSYIECYIKDHKGVSVERARAEVIQMISDAWKRLNRECLHDPSPFSTIFTKACLNTARVVPLIYSYDDNRSLSILEDHMKSILDGTVYL